MDHTGWMYPKVNERHDHVILDKYQARQGHIMISLAKD